MRGATVWLTGLSGSGKSTVASALTTLLTERGVLTYTLDGDNLRHGLNGDLGFSADDRTENVRRVGEVARLFADAGDRHAWCRSSVPTVPGVITPGRCTTPPACRSSRCSSTRRSRCAKQRDPKGLYKQARAGEITGFTGIDDPYEPPLRPSSSSAPGLHPPRIPRLKSRPG